MNFLDFAKEKIYQLLKAIGGQALMDKLTAMSFEEHDHGCGVFLGVS